MSEPTMKRPMTEEDRNDPSWSPKMPPQQGISGQQMQGLVKGYADQLAAIKRDVDLRKWAVDQACGLIGAAFEAEVTPIGGDVVSLSRSIHAFLVEGAKEPE